MFNIGPPELIIILVLALIIFGPKRLPEIGKTVGKSLKEFRTASADIRRELREGLEEHPAAPGTPTSNGEAADAGVAAVTAAAGDTPASAEGPGTASPHPVQEPPSSPEPAPES
jgi:sec-independent protein translocase protein TatA